MPSTPLSSPKPSPKSSPKPSPRFSPAKLHRIPNPASPRSPRSPAKPSFDAGPSKPSFDDNASSNVAVLHRLVHHYIASKRSLQATSYIVKAHELVAAARPGIERIAALKARNAFARAQIGGVLSRARAVRVGLGVVRDDVVSQFQALLQSLDTVDARVKQSIHLLKGTTVDAAFGHADGTPRTLHDFLDEKGLTEITGALHECIDSASEAQGDFGDLLDEFDAKLDKIAELAAQNRPGDEEAERIEAEGQAAAQFREMEAHATEMAAALQSLVRNYDLCVTALKHTEGGGEAALQAQAALTASGVADNSEAFGPAHQPMSVEERSELLDVLEKDADMVDDVVLEIRDRADVMEGRLEKIYERVGEREGECEAMSRAIEGLQELNVSLDGYIDNGSRLVGRWVEVKERIEEQMEELEGIRDFYDGFLGAYSELMRELKRRESCRNKMEKIAADAMAKLEKLYQEDLEERETFRSDQGEFLPLDLWPGMTDLPDKFELRRVAAEPVVPKDEEAKPSELQLDGDQSLQDSEHA